MAPPSLPDGMVISSVEAPDPAWDMQSPFTRSATLTWPSGRTLSMSTQREATFDDPQDALTLTTRTDRLTVGGKTTRQQPSLENQ